MSAEQQASLFDWHWQPGVVYLTPHRPLFGNVNPKKSGTHWIVYMKSAGEGPV